MSARDAMAAMMDELMGPQRNASGQTSSFSFRDESVCKYALADFCPHDLFVHTKGDLGQCPKIHDDKLRLEYQASSEYGKLGYERRLLQFLEKLHDDMQYTIKSEKKKLLVQYGGDRDKDMADLDAEIEKCTKQAETAGEMGDVEECRKYMDKVDQLKAEKMRKDRINEVGHREMEICEICARRLIIGDAPQRVEEHLTGKMHVGYIRIAETIEKLKAQVEHEKANRELIRSSEPSRRERGDERKRSRSRDRKDRRRSRSRDRKKDSRKRSRSRSRSRDRRRSGRR